MPRKDCFAEGLLLIREDNDNLQNKTFVVVAVLEADDHGAIGVQGLHGGVLVHILALESSRRGQKTSLCRQLNYPGTEVMT